MSIEELQALLETAVILGEDGANALHLYKQAVFEKYGEWPLFQPF